VTVAKRVYFAFHYQDVSEFRANVVRKHNALQGVAEAGYYDASIWEESKKKGDVALKRLINAELEYTSVTAVLIGSQTYARRWVRYEIMKSVARGNKLLGIHINGITGKDEKSKPNGPNPFDNLGLQLSDDGGTLRPTEWNGQKWVWYQDLEPFTNPRLSVQPGVHQSLSFWFPVYDWVLGDGYSNFGKWVE
jgi:hypothetical protein